MGSSKFVLFLIPVMLGVSFLVIEATSAFAEESPIIARVEIWGLFYRLMIIAFTVGAVIMGVLAYVVFRFRESNPKNQPKERVEGHQ